MLATARHKIQRTSEGAPTRLFLAPRHPPNCAASVSLEVRYSDLAPTSRSDVSDTPSSAAFGLVTSRRPNGLFHLAV